MHRLVHPGGVVAESAAGERVCMLRPALPPAVEHQLRPAAQLRTTMTALRRLCLHTLALEVQSRAAYRRPEERQTLRRRRGRPRWSKALSRSERCSLFITSPNPHSARTPTVAFALPTGNNRSNGVRHQPVFFAAKDGRSQIASREGCFSSCQLPQLSGSERCAPGLKGESTISHADL